MKEAVSRLSLVLIVLLFIAGGTARAEVIYDEWVLAGNNITFDGNKLNLTYSFESVSLFTQFDGESYIIKNNSCEYLNNYRFCFEGTRFSFDKGYGKWDMELSLAIPELHLVIEKPSSEIEVKRSYSPKVIFVDDKITIELTLHNTGETLISDIEYNEELPDNVEVISSSEFIRDYHKLTWRGVLKKDESKTLVYKIRLLNESKAVLKGYYSYPHEDKKLYFKSSDTTINPEKVAIVETSVTPESATINSEIRYNLLIENNVDEPITVSLAWIKIFKPNKFEINSRDFSVNMDHLNWSGIIEAHSSKTLSFTLSAKKSINTTINTEVKYLYKNHSYKFNSEDKVSFSAKSIIAKVTLFGSEVESDDYSYAKIEIENTDSLNYYYKINYSITSDFFGNHSGVIDKLKPKQSIVVFSDSFKVPWVEEEESHYLIINGSYLTKAQEMSYFNSGTYFKFIPKKFKPVLSINISCPAAVTAGKSFICSLFLNSSYNKRIYDINESYLTNFPIKLVSSNSNMVKSINPYKNAVIDHKFKVENLPDGYNNSLIIKFIVDYKKEIIGEVDERQKIGIQRTIHVTLNENKEIQNKLDINASSHIAENITQNITETSNNITTNPGKYQWHSQRVKKSIIRRIIEWIKGWFSK